MPRPMPAYPSPAPAYGVANGLPQPAPARPAVPLAEQSISMPTPARRPWGLIVAVLLIDVGLAVAGSWMLSQGLGDPLPSESK